MELFPKDVLVSIFSYLSAKTVLNLELTCKLFQRAAPSVWKIKLKQDFGVDDIGYETDDKKQYFWTAQCQWVPNENIKEVSNHSRTASILTDRPNQIVHWQTIFTKTTISLQTLPTGMCFFELRLDIFPPDFLIKQSNNWAFGFGLAEKKNYP